MLFFALNIQQLQWGTAIRKGAREQQKAKQRRATTNMQEKKIKEVINLLVWVPGWTYMLPILEEKPGERAA